MPEQIFLPDCLMDCYRYMFPNMDWSCVTFYHGMPSAAFGNPRGFTMAFGLGFFPDIRVYVRDYDPCGQHVVPPVMPGATFVTIAHELVHVTQIQRMNGGGAFPGSWATYYMSHCICAGGKTDCSMDLEREAYEFAEGCHDGEGRLVTCISAAPMYGDAPCDCAPSFWPQPRTYPAPKIGLPPKTYVETLSDCKNVQVYFSGVGHTLCSVIAGIFGLLFGALSVFAYRNTGGAIGAAVGAVAGAIVGGIIGGLFFGWPGAVAGAYVGFIVGAIVGGAIGFAINWFATQSTGGAIGVAVGAVAGGVAGGIIGGILFGPLGAVVGAFLGAVIGAVIGGAVVFAVNWALSWIPGWDSGAASRIWFTVFDDHSNSWMIPDYPVTHGGNSLTSRRPALAVLNGQLFCVYRSSDDDSLWYNVFDGTKWKDHDEKITYNGHTKTHQAPALAAYDGKLYMAYKSNANDHLWYNVYEDGAWLDRDIPIPSSQSSSGPALAECNGLLYLAYKGKPGHHTIWYNVFDKATQSWWSDDRSISHGGNTLTDAEPTLAAYTDATGNRKLYVAYRGSGDTHMWYNVFDGSDWQYQDTRVPSGETTHGPSLVEYHGKLYLFYRSRWNDDLWYNVFDGNVWDDSDHDISRDDHVLSKYGPASAVFLNLIFLVYRDNS